MPANPNTDTKVTQTVSTENNNYPILASATANKSSSSTEAAIFSTLLSMNPATGQITGWSNGGAYAICSTALYNSTKSVTLPGLTLTPGMTVTVLFDKGNDAAAPRLNVNSKGAKSIKVYLNGSKKTVTRGWDAGTSMTLMFDGTDFVVLGNPVVMSKFGTNVLGETAGYIKYANGLIIQWKYVSSGSNNTVSNVSTKLLISHSNTEYACFLCPAGYIEDATMNWNRWGLEKVDGITVKFQNLIREGMYILTIGY